MFAGIFLETAYAATDTEGKTVKDELHKIGYAGDVVPGTHPIGAYFEAHIEQGPILEDKDITIGVVQAVLGIRWYDCIVTGMESDAGPTPMAMRKDALQVATQIMQEVVNIAGQFAPHGRGTVGMVQVYPNSRNVVPGSVKFSIDFRNMTDAEVDEMDAALKTFIAQTVQKTGLQVEPKQVSQYPAAPFHPDCKEAVRRAAQKTRLFFHGHCFGAGHDAVYMSMLAPAGMIFIPCKDGISHNEIEYSSPEQVTSGANVLLHAMPVPGLCLSIVIRYFIPNPVAGNRVYFSADSPFLQKTCSIMPCK